MSKVRTDTIYFDKCPVCGSKERICETLGKELIERGQARKEFNFAFHSAGGPCLDQSHANKIPIGGSIQIIQANFDICASCGCYYATKVILSEGKKSVRVDIPQDKLPPFANNPRLS